MPNASLPIGVFDSGVGGLTVLHAMRDRLPAEDFLYLGDTARVPYGTKSEGSVQRYALHAAHHLVGRGIKLLVVACNTASAVGLQVLREELAPMPVIGVVEPGAAAAVELNPGGRHVVLATEATSSRKAYTAAIRQLDSAAEVEEHPCSLFVSLAEEGWVSGSIPEAVAEEYLGSIRDRIAAERPHTAILGCTHFPLLADVIQATLGADIQIVDSAQTTAAEVQRELQRRNLLTEPSSAAGKLHLIATDGASRFARIGSAFLGDSFSADDIELTDIHPTDLSA